jgi:uncharacterized protein (DUF2342 family)
MRPDTTFPLNGSDTVRSEDIPRPVMEFYLRLRRLPLGEWARAASQAAAESASDPEQPSTCAIARARLRDISERMPRAVTRIRSRVHDLVSMAEGFVSVAEMRQMKKAALTAALALAAREELGETDFLRLYGPFATLIPHEHL